MGKGATRSKFLIRKGGVEQGMVDHPGNLLVVILFYVHSFIESVPSSSIQQVWII
jgi:hypothetical protein